MGCNEVQEVEAVVGSVGRIEEFNAEHKERLAAFLDRNGYTAREVRAIVATAIALWATQEG